MSRHASLSPEHWARFTSDQQLMMIANEMRREALRHLLLFSFQTARQIPFVLGDAPAGAP